MQKIVICFFLWLAPVFGGSFHAIMLLDTSAFDISKGVHANYDLWIQEFYEIGEYTGMEVRVHPFFGGELDDEVMNRIEEIEVEQDDVIFFYAACHGVNVKEGPFPTLQFNGFYLDQERVLAILKEKKARLLICMSDACNHFVKAIPDFWIPASAYPEIEEVRRERYSSLYLDEEGVLMIAGASPGEFAMYGMQGGVFTRSFLRSFHYLADYGDIVTWDTVMSLTAEHMDRMVKGQHPYYEWR